MYTLSVGRDIALGIKWRERGAVAEKTPLNEGGKLSRSEKKREEKRITEKGEYCVE